MNKFMVFLYFLLLTLFCKPSEAVSQKILPKVVNGTLDLRNWDFAKDGVVSLDGEWEFYPNEFLRVTPLWDTDRRREFVSYIQVPSKWESFQKAKSLEKIHFGSYRLKILLPNTEEYLSLKLNSISSAYSFYVNGLLISKGGTISNNKNEASPGYTTGVFDLMYEQESIELIFHVSNFHYQNGSGIWGSIDLGLAPNIVSKAKDLAIIDAMTIGTLLIMALYHFSFFFIRRKENSALYFGLFCLCVAIRVSMYGERIIQNLLPFFANYFFIVRGEILSLYLILILFIKYLQNIFPENLKKDKFTNVLFYIFSIYPIVGTFTPIEIYTKEIFVVSYQYLILFFLFLLLLKIPGLLIQNRDGAKTFSIGLLVNLFTVINDFLLINYSLDTIYLGPFGFLAFVFSQSILLSTKFSKAFIQSENLGNKLKELNESLEAKVEDRTKELDEAKKEIEAMNQFTNLVNSLTSLGEIFTEISRYVYEKYSIAGTWLFLPDTKKEYLYAYKTYSYTKLNRDQYDYMMNKKIPMQENEGGITYKTFQRKKPFYLIKISKFEFAIDKEIIETLSIKSTLHIPLVRNDHCVGILLFSNLNTEMKLSKNEIRTVTNLCSQIAGAIDTNHLLQQVQTEKEKAIAAQSESEKAKAAIERVAEAVKLVNSSENLMYVVQFVIFYLEEEFHFDITWLLLVEENTNCFVTHSLVGKTSNENLNYVQNLKIPIEKESGIIYSTHLRKKIFYLPRLPRKANGLDAEILKRGGGKFILQVPLVIRDKTIGILNLTSTKEVIRLSKNDLSKLQLFTDQIAGAIYNSFLSEKTIQAKEEVEKQKRETEELNKLIKNLNEEFDLKVIVKKLNAYIKKKYSIDYYLLGVVEENKIFGHNIEGLFPDFIDDQEKEKIMSLKTQISEGKVGAYAFAFMAKRTVFFSSIKKKGMTENEIYVLEKIKAESFLIMPLILDREPIGFLSLYNVGKMVLSKSDISHLSILGEQLAGIIHGSNLFKQVQEEKEKAIIAQSETEKSRLEIQSLNEFSKIINATNDLNEILDFVLRYLEREFSLKSVWLQLVDQEKQELYFHSYKDFDLNEKRRNEFNEKIMHVRISLEEIDSSNVQAYYRKTIHYLSRLAGIKKIFYLDEQVTKILNLKFLLQIPLIVNKSVVGILNVNKFGEQLRFKKEDLRKISRIAEQLALAINNSALYEKAESERQKSEKLLLNILPKDVARELKEKGFAEPELFENVSVMFTDFKGFTQIAETLTPQELIKDLDACFVQFDKITERVGLEKLKTIGDSYMCAGGIPKRNTTHAIDCVLAALEIQSFMNMMKRLKEEKGFPYWELRLGIHSGPLVAGVIGERKFAYDVWGDTVNTASRMESSGTPGKINISYSTYELVKHLFDCEYRGEVSAKNKGVVKMYYLNRIKPEFSKDELGMIPNGKFWEMYR